VVAVDLDRENAEVALDWLPPPGLRTSGKGFTGIAWLDVPGYQKIQIYNGSFPNNFKGCVGAGTVQSTDFLGGTVNSLNQINNVIKLDGTGNIKVIVAPIQ
jgi:hypothetical protein